MYLIIKLKNSTMVSHIWCINYIFKRYKLLLNDKLLATIYWVFSRLNKKIAKIIPRNFSVLSPDACLHRERDKFNLRQYGHFRNSEIKFSPNIIILQILACVDSIAIGSYGKCLNAGRSMSTVEKTTPQWQVREYGPQWQVREHGTPKQG